MEENVFHACDFKPNVSGFLLVSEAEDLEVHTFLGTVGLFVFSQFDAHLEVHLDADVMPIRPTGVELRDVFGINESKQLCSFDLIFFFQDSLNLHF